jgi:CHAT domain-containing protein/tetratricopeptide (TPR) repeat protein
MQTPSDTLFSASLEADGRRAYERGEYAEALGPWEAALAAARVEADRSAEATILTSLGLAAWRLGDYEQSAAWGEEAVRLELRHGFDDLLPRSYNALGLLSWEQSHFDDAILLFEQSLAAAERTGDLEYVAKSIANLGLVYEAVGEFGTARDRYLTALAAARDLGDARTEGRILVNLAALDRQTGDPASALGWLDAAREMDIGSFDPTGEEAMWGQLASLHVQLGDARLAVAALDTALRLARAQGLRAAEAANQELLAEVHRQAGDHRRALRLYEQARLLNEELGLTTEAGDDLRAQAQIYAALENSPLALARADDALALHRSVGAAFSELEDLLVLAELKDRTGDSVGATAFLAAARNLTARLGAPSAAMDVRLTEARIADRHGDSDAVLQALAVDAEDLADVVAWETELLRARAYARRNDLEAAAGAGRLSVAAVERLRLRHGSGALRTAFAVDRAAPYFELTEILLRLGRTNEAFEVADAARGRSFRESLAAAARRDDDSSDYWTRGLAEEEELLAAIDGLLTSIREYEEWGDAEAVEDLRQRLRRARRDYEAVAIRRRELVSEAEVRGVEAGAQAVQEALGPGEVLLEYLVTPERLYTFVVTSGSIRALASDESASGVAARVRLARDLLADPQTPVDRALAVLGALDEVLLAPARAAGAFEGVSRILIVPHHALSYLPFAVLRSAGTAGRYLVEDYETVFLPAAAALPAIRMQRPSDSGPVSGASVFAPRPRELPASREEAEAVRRLLPHTDVYLGNRATEARLRDALEGGGVTHVASHGVLNTVNPLFSRIELASGGSPVTSADDGRLEVHEILDITIRSRLVFLSGCETGLGRAGLVAAAPGEDYATLARAFLYGGAHSVVATLWPVADAGAAAFAARFYDGLDADRAPEALARAQRGMLSDPRYAHPYYWAGYQVAGGGSSAAAADAANRRVVSVSH